MNALPDYEGHLKRNAEGDFVGALTDGRDKPIYLEAEIIECPSGRYFRLRGTKVKGKHPVSAALFNG